MLTYIEPFVGGANVIDKIVCTARIGSDIHKELIAMWKALQNGWLPPEHISYDEYAIVRDNRDKFPDYYVGYVGFHATFGAKYYEGYARGFKADKITPRDMSHEAYKNTMKQIPQIKTVIFENKDYVDIKANNAVIYCDPPYDCVTKYHTKHFEYDEFWKWCKKMSKTNIVLVSNYSAPDDFECVWEKKHIANFDNERNINLHCKDRVERLYLVKP